MDLGKFGDTLIGHTDILDVGSEGGGSNHGDA